MVYAATLTEYQRVMRWKIVPKEFVSNIQYINGVENILACKISTFPSVSVDKYYTCTRKAQCCANELFVISKA